MPSMPAVYRVTCPDCAVPRIVDTERRREAGDAVRVHKLLYDHQAYITRVQRAEVSE